MAASFLKSKTTCGLCGTFVPLIRRTYAKDGIICRSCEQKLRPAFPKYEGVRRLTFLETGEFGSHETTLDLLDPIEDETIESLRRHLDPPRYLAKEREACPVEDKDAYTVVLANIRRGQAVPVTKAVVHV